MLHCPRSALPTTFAGGVTTGCWVLFTVTTKLHVALFPAASVTRNTLVVLPAGKVEPLPRPATCVVAGPAQLSVPTGAA